MEHIKLAGTIIGSNSTREREREREWGVGGGKRILVSKLTHRKKLLILGLGRLLPRLSDIK